VRDESAPVLLYDGTCGFCADSVQFVLKRDRTRTMRFAALESAFGRSVLARHPEIQAFDSVLYVAPARDGKPEQIHARSSAVMQVASYLGGRWRLLKLAGIVPSFIRDGVYRLVARHRHKLSSHSPQCDIPSEQDRSRFLD